LTEVKEEETKILQQSNQKHNSTNKFFTL